MRQNKLVSVIIPAYNKAEYTLLTIKSVIKQTYKPIEIIVVDDGSTDNTKKILEDFSDKIKYIYQENSGASSARNLGTKKATGSYLAYLDCDDLYYPDKIKNSIEVLEKNKDYDFLYTNVDQIDETNKIVGEFPDILVHGKTGLIFEDLFLQNFICNSTLVIRKSCINKSGYFDEKIFVPADWDFLLRLSQNHQGFYLPDKLTGYRIVDQSTFNQLDTVVDEYIYVIKKNFNSYKKLSKKKLNNSFANAYYLHAKNFAAKGNINRSRELFFRSIIHAINHPKLFKMIVGYLMCILLPKNIVINFFRKKQIFNS
tara:strand:+ start:1251 stop:2189 length:939 start_codon:yes stop_codon:yes gene_type:complete